MTKTIFYIIFLYGLMASTFCIAQQPAYTYYSLRDGLPSNDIYNCVEDKKGFLWIATENGLSKFDGKNFRNYFTKDGLPDNDILSVLLDSAGVLWVLPFQKTPAYYDEKNDRFINQQRDTELGKIELGNLNYGNALFDGGMSFYNNKNGIFIYKNKKLVKINVSYTTWFNRIRVIHLANNHQLIVSTDSLRLVFDNKIIRSQLLGINFTQSAFVNNCLYFTDSISLIKIPILADGKMGNKTVLPLPFPPRGFNFTGKQLALSSINGNIYFADTATLSFSQQAFSFNSLARFVCEDKAGNTWICTKENGLIRYQQKGILSIASPAFQRNFNTLSFLNNLLVAGTNSGQLIVYKSTFESKSIALKKEKNFATWIRKMVPTAAGIYIGAEGGLFFLNKKFAVEELINNNRNIASKDFLVLNDSVIIAGNSGNLSKVNITTLKTTAAVKLRVTALEADAKNNIYVGSNTGLYQWKDFKELIDIGKKYSLLSTRVLSLAYSKQDDILWTGLSTDTIVALQNNKPIAIIPLGVTLPGNNCRALLSVKKGVLWVGTNMALGRINYSFVNNRLQYSIAFFTTADGIAGKQVNDIEERNDTVYVATTAGISIVPSSLLFNVQQIPVYVTKIKINNADTSLLDYYRLGYEQNNISISFSAADLAATTAAIYEYRINNNVWITTTIENISLPQLAPGKYTVQIRAIKRDGNPSEKIAQVLFIIATPLWKNPYLILIVLFGFITAMFYLIQKRSKVKRERSIQQLLTEKKLSELELKALKAQINPHFVFNCLNSIKYLNHQKRFEETDLYLDKFSYLLRKTLDFSGLQKITMEEELAYSRNYLELERLRLGNRLNYQINIDEAINTQKIMVPPMLFQPYLENAIKHGIRHLQSSEGLVVIDIKTTGDKVICTITDNGVGIDKANFYNAMAAQSHQSYGNNLQQRRADLYNVSVSIANAENNNGTMVTLNFANEA